MAYERTTQATIDLTTEIVTIFHKEQMPDQEERIDTLAVFPLPEVKAVFVESVYFDLGGQRMFSKKGRDLTIVVWGIPIKLRWYDPMMQHGRGDQALQHEAYKFATKIGEYVRDGKL